MNPLMNSRFICALALVLTFSVGCGASSYETSGSSYEPGVMGVTTESMSTQSDSSGASAVRASESVRGVSRSSQSITRKFSRNAGLVIEVDDKDDFARTIKRAKVIAQAYKGYIKAETTKSVSIKVPTQSLQPVLKKLEALGEVISKNISVNDVTARYVDLQIRIKNLEIMRERLTQLVAQSEKVPEILAVERELQRVTTTLERTKGQMRMLQNQTSYATVNVRLSESVTPGPIGWVFYGTYVAVKWLFVWD